MTTTLQASNYVESVEFLPRIAHADKAAARECVDFYGAMIWALAKQSIASNEMAEKAVQEIFLDIWENASFCDLAVSAEKVWIVMIANRRLEKYAAAIVL